jgi:hypothetical protein
MYPLGFNTFATGASMSTSKPFLPLHHYSFCVRMGPTAALSTRPRGPGDVLAGHPSIEIASAEKHNDLEVWGGQQNCAGPSILPAKRLFQAHWGAGRASQPFGRCQVTPFRPKYPSSPKSPRHRQSLPEFLNPQIPYGRNSDQHAKKEGGSFGQELDTMR